MVVMLRRVLPIVLLVLLSGVLTPGAIGQDELPLTAPWHQRMKVARSNHYIIHSDLSEDETRDYARHLDIVYQAYVKRLGSLRQRAPQSLNVYLFAKRDDYLRTLESQFGIDGTGSGGMFFVNQRGNGLAIWTEGLPRQRVEHVIQHEGFHQVAFALFGGELPVWANEGLAEFFGEGVVVGNELVIGQNSPRTLSALRDAIEKNEVIPFTTMLTLSGQAWNANVTTGNARLQYQQAWSMVHFLVYGDGGRYRNAFERYLRFLNMGNQSLDAWVKAFGNADLSSFEQRWAEFIQQAKPSAFLTALERMEFLAAGLSALHQRGEQPTTFAELRTKLEEIGFRYSIQQHGITTVFEASDAALFEIPMDDLTKDQPVFIVEKTRRRMSSYRERKLEEDHPLPAEIRTEHLRPNNLRVEWFRDGDDPSRFYFEIEVD